jgi:hypothetical protein
VFSFKPDYEISLQRMNAFWHRELIDRPVVQIALAKPLDQRVPEPESRHATPAERWLDTEYQTALALARLSNREFLGDAMPIAYPNLGPEVFSSFYGCPIEFGDFGTSWTRPNLHDWSQVEQLRLDWHSPYLKKLHEMTDALLDVAKGKFIVGMADWHPGGDCLAAFRDPQTLAVDMVEHLDAVKALLPRVEADYFAIYDMFYDKLRAAGQPITTWLPLVYEGKYYVPSNDFSGLISTRMFEEVFLPGIINECRFLDRTIYHLDGPGALRHLDLILGIPELHAVQWVPGAGRVEVVRWIGTYRRIQAAGKGLQVNAQFEEVDTVMEALDPHGVFMIVGGVPSREAAEELLKKSEQWATGRA